MLYSVDDEISILSIVIETISLFRDQIGSRLHFTCFSAASSLALLRFQTFLHARSRYLNTHNHSYLYADIIHVKESDYN